MMEGMSQEGVSMGNFDRTEKTDWRVFIDELLNQHDPHTGIYRIHELRPSDEDWLAACLADDDLILEDFGSERLVFQSSLDGVRVTAIYESNEYDGTWIVKSVKRIPYEPAKEGQS